MDTITDLLNQYSKQQGNSDLRESVEHKDISDGFDIIKSDDNVISDDYKKGDGLISSFLIVVISGGEVRESDYLSELSMKKTFPHIKLIFVSSEKGKGGLSPKMMHDKLNDIIEYSEPTKTSKILYSSIDKIFMISDVDHYYDDLVQLLPDCTDPKEIWVISNPCFEIWLYYAHFDEIRDEIRVLESLPQSQHSSTLKTINDTIVKGGIDPRKAFGRIQTANENSKKNYSIDENNIPKLYSTTMYVFGEYVLNAIGANEFEKWLEEKQKKIESYRTRVT